MCTINQSTGQICFPFIAKRPPRDLQIMVCSCAMSPNCVWLQITFCFCINETTLFSFLQGCPPCGIVCQNLFYSIVYHSKLIVVFLCFLYYNSTSIEIMSRSLGVRYHAPGYDYYPWRKSAREFLGENDTDRECLFSGEFM